MPGFNEAPSAVSEFLAHVSYLSQRCAALAVERDRVQAKYDALVKSIEAEKQDKAPAKAA